MDLLPPTGWVGCFLPEIPPVTCSSSDGVNSMCMPRETARVVPRGYATDFARLCAGNRVLEDAGCYFTSFSICSFIFFTSPSTSPFSKPPRM
jgi:hypothetical protein